MNPNWDVLSSLPPPFFSLFFLVLSVFSCFLPFLSFLAQVPGVEESAVPEALSCWYRSW